MLQDRTTTSGCRTLCMAFAMGLLISTISGCATTKDAQKPVDLVWPLPPEQPRVKFVRTVRSEADVGATRNRSGKLKDFLLGRQDEIIPIKKPYGVHADREGRLFVTDTGWGKVLVFDFKNKQFSVWGIEGRGLLSKPAGITSDSQQRIYVTDLLQKRVVVYDRDGNFLRGIGKKGQLERPVGVAVDEKLGRVYVVDVKKHHIAVFDMKGKRVSTLGRRGAKPGQFNFPTNVAIDRQGKLYVVDSMNFRVQIIDPDGRVLRTFGEIGDGLGKFTRPKGIGVDSEGHIYVVDAAFNNFQIFDQRGSLLLFVGSIGREPGQFWLPGGAYVDDQNRIYVADQYNFRVQVFQYLGERGTGKNRAGPSSAIEEPQNKTG